MKISHIKIERRRRTEPGDINALAASIKSVGLLHPVVVDPDGKLIAGGRRLLAAEKLGWKDIEATVATSLDSVEQALLAERDENTCRKDFTPSEAVAMAKALEPFEKKAAKERKAENGRISGRGHAGIGREKITPPIQKAKAADRVAEAVGMSRPTLDRATRGGSSEKLFFERREAVIDLTKDTLILLSQARHHHLLARLGHKGKPVSFPTIWGWTENGCRGVFLEYRMTPAGRATTDEAIVRFIDEVSRAKPRIRVGRTPRQAAKSKARAIQVLTKAGISLPSAISLGTNGQRIPLA